MDKKSAIYDTINTLYERMINDHCERANRLWLANLGVEHNGDCFLSKCQERTPISRYNIKIRQLSSMILSKLPRDMSNDTTQIYLAMNELILRSELYIESREAYLFTSESVRDATDEKIDVSTCIPVRKKISRMCDIIDKILANYDDIIISS